MISKSDVDDDVFRVRVITRGTFFHFFLGPQNLNKCRSAFFKFLHEVLWLLWRIKKPILLRGLV